MNKYGRLLKKAESFRKLADYTASQTFDFYYRKLEDAMANKTLSQTFQDYNNLKLFIRKHRGELRDKANKGDLLLNRVEKKLFESPTTTSTTTSTSNQSTTNLNQQTPQISVPRTEFSPTKIYPGPKPETS